MADRFVRMRVSELRLPFRFAFEHALARRRESHTLVVSLTTDSGHTGYGEVLAREYLTGETLAGAWKDLQQEWWPRLRELCLPTAGDARALVTLLRPLYLRADACGRTAAWSGVDVAAVDAFARSLGIPGARLFGQKPRAQKLTAPLGMLSPLRGAWLARVCRWLGFEQFKLKAGRTDDAARALVARRAIGVKRDLRVDANAAWDVEQAVIAIEAMRPAGVSSVEQPVAAQAGRAGALLEVQRRTGVPIMADESLCTLADARALLGGSATERVLLWNVRLAKVGGFSGALELIRIATEHGVGVHLGVLVGETGVLAAAQRGLWGVEEFTHVEHGFNRLLLKRDPFVCTPGGCTGTGSPLRPLPGLGVTPDPSVFARACVRQETWE